MGTEDVSHSSEHVQVQGRKYMYLTFLYMYKYKEGAAVI